MGTNVQLSQRLKIVSKCSMSTIPSYFFTESRFLLRTSIQSDNGECSPDDLFADEELFGSGNCLIAKLERYESKNDSMSFHMKKSNNRTTEAWREAVRNGTYKLDLDNDLMGKTLLSTYFVIYSDKKLEGNVKRCIMLDSNAPLAGQAKSYEVVTDTRLANTSEVSIDSNGPSVTIMNGEFPDLDDLQEFVDCAVSEVIKEMKSRHPEKSFDDAQLEKDAFAVIAKFLQGQYKTTKTTLPDPKECQECQALPFDGYEARPVDCDNKRFLSFVQHCKKQNNDKKTLANDGMMVPSGDYVVLEAKEMLKHFNIHDGMPKKSKELIVVKPVRKSSIRDGISENDLKSNLKWPEILLTKYHDLYYNKSENSEKNDAVNAKIQQMYVGSRETASTCHVLNSHQTVVHTKPFATNNIPDLVVPKAEGQKTNLRRTPRKVKRSITTIETKKEPQKDDPRMIFKQKLRNAVYDALSDEGIKGKNDPLFMPCFKRLFEICNVYAKDMPKNTASTKQWLGVVARQNATTVIDL